MAIEKDLLDQLLAGRDPKDVFNKDGLVDELKKALSERILNTELDEHLGSDGVEGKRNHRNGYSKKSVLTGTSKMTLSVPRDRAGTFDPKLIAKYQRRFPDFDDKIISMYARGMTVREIRGHLEELYGIDVSPDLISAVTDAVLDEVTEWQNRPLDICYPLVFFDAIRVKVRDEGFVRNKAIYIALGVLPDGTKEILGIWIEQTEGAKFWLRVVNELKTRGVQDILIAVVDGLKGFPEAITAVFPRTIVQTCIVDLIRHSMDFASWKDRKSVAQALRTVYRAVDAAAGLKGVGRIYQQTFIDTYSKVACAKLYDRKTPITAADLLNDRVLPFFDEHEVKLLRMLTDRGTEYCGNPEHHEYELYLAVEDIDHTRTKTKSPQTNGICERFHKTVLNEFYRVAFRKKVYRSIDELQTDLDLWVRDYNEQRPHQGRWCFGKTPMQTFLDAMPIAKEKTIAA